MFLDAHARFVSHYAGHELAWNETTPGVDHTWRSATDGNEHALSGVIYAHLCFTPEVPGVTGPKARDADEARRFDQQRISSTRVLFEEAHSTRMSADDPDAVLEICDAALRVLDLWERAIEHIR